MVAIDTNSLIILILGLIDKSLISKHKRTSIYEEQDFDNLLAVIGDLNHLIVIPNVWTEVDNLLNNFNGTHKFKYVRTLFETAKQSSEHYISSQTGIQNPYFYDLGLTDTLLLQLSNKYDLLVTSDSALSDYAIASGIAVFDLVKNRNIRL